MEVNEVLSHFDLRSPRLLDEIANSYNEKIVGETNNKKMVFLACLTKDLPRDYKFSIIVVSRSSSGKTNLIKNIVKPFEKDVIHFTNATDSFNMRTMSYVGDKIIFKEQLETVDDKGRATMRDFKFLLSEGEIKTGISEKEDGKWTPKTFNNNGIPVFLTTSTNPNTDIETMNRLFVLSIDESESQTKLIMNNITSEHSTPNFENSWNKTLENLNGLVSFYQELAKTTTGVIIPFLDKIVNQMPTKQHEMRRDYSRIIQLCKVIAFSHSVIRKRIRDNKGKTLFKDQYGKSEKVYTYTVIAELDDFKEALEIANLQQTLNKLDEKSIKVLDCVKDMKARGDLANTKNVSLEVGLSQNRTGEILRNLMTNDFLNRDKLEREYVYDLTKKELETIDFQNVTFTNQELETWFIKHYSTEDDRFEIVNPK